MSLQTASALGVVRRDRRVTSYCDIWDLVAPEVTCPACSGAHDERLQAAEVEAPTLPTAAVPEHLQLVGVGSSGDEEHEVAPTMSAPMPRGDVHAEASALLSLLAS